MAIIRGTAGNDNLKGSSKNDKLCGYEGNDTLDGGAGINTLIGGTGNDVYIVDSRTDVIIEKTDGGYDTLRSSVSYTLGSNLEKLVLTGSGNIDGRGNKLDNFIIGNRGRNVLNGGAGNDTLDGSHDDRSDTLYGGVGNDSLIGASKDKLYGEVGDDRLIGEPSGFFDNPGDTIYMDGGDGNDYLYSRHDAEMYGGRGNDTIRGGTSVYIDGGDGNDLLDGDESTIYGGKGNDTITGNYSSLYGGDGDDVLSGNSSMEGGRGNDTLTGGDSDNYFVFTAPTDGVDTITNFLADKGDQIIISASGFGGGLVAGELTPGQLQFGTSAKEADDRFIYDTSSGALYFDVDGIGTSKQTQLAILVGVPELPASSIYINS